MQKLDTFLQTFWHLSLPSPSVPDNPWRELVSKETMVLCQWVSGKQYQGSSLLSTVHYVLRNLIQVLLLICQMLQHINNGR